MRFSQEIINEYVKKYFPKALRLDFIGSSSDFFVGRFNYPNIFVGILAPPEHNSEADKMSMPEHWFKNKFTADDILMNRSKLIYSRIKSEIKIKESRLIDTMQEVSMAKNSVDVEFILKRQPKLTIKLDKYVPPIGNPAPLIKAEIQDNVKVDHKVDYFISDYDLKAQEALIELHKSGINISYMIRILSAGLLGTKIQRKLVPTRWSVTAVDSQISDRLIKRVKNYNWINEFQVYYSEYLGNHFEVLLIPKEFGFEVIETLSNNYSKHWHDYETHFGRKKYADGVTGFYYAGRLACAEYLGNIKRQASVVIFRTIKPSYNIPLGVGILRETVRDAFKHKLRRFGNLNDALNDIGLRVNTKKLTENSVLIKHYKEQARLIDF